MRRDSALSGFGSAIDYRVKNTPRRYAAPPSGGSAAPERKPARVLRLWGLAYKMLGIRRLFASRPAGDQQALGFSPFAQLKRDSHDKI
jgi:hypothetical protein